MKKLHIIVSSALFALVLAVTGGLTVRNAHAATGSIYLSPSSQSIQNGSSFTLNLRVNPGTTIDTVSAQVSFDATKLSLTGISCSGSPFTPVSCTSANPAHIDAADLGGTVTTDSFVASLTFKANVGSGSSSITVSGDTAYAGNAIGAGTAGTSVSFTTPACPAGYTGTYPNCTAPSSGGSSGGGTSSGGSSGGTTTKPKTTTTTPPKTTTTPPPTTTPVANVDGSVTVKDQNVQFTQAVFTATSQIPTSVYCQFGTDSKGLTQQTAADALGTDHKITFDSSTLTPGVTYYYVVVSKDQKGNVTQSQVQTFKTKGLTVTVGVFDKNHHPIKNKKVTLHSDPVTAQTDSKGNATFTEVTPGDHHVIYANGSKSYDQQISVSNNVVTAADTQSAPVQNVSVVYGFAQSSNMMVRVVILVLLVIVVAIVIIAITRRKVRFAAPGGSPLSMDPVVVGGHNNYQGGDTPSSQETSDRLNRIPPPDQPSPGSTFTPRDDQNGQGDGRGF